MDSILKKKIINKVLAKIPTYINPVDFLHDVLNISKESIYRRLKGEIAFTLEDLVKISSSLFISLDDIIYADQNNDLGKQPIVFQSRSDELFEPKKTFVEFLSTYLQNIDETSKAQNAEVMVAANRLMILTAVSFDHLFKFYYYRWIHQTQRMPLEFGMSSVILTDEIISLQEKLKTHIPSGKHTYILDFYFLESTIREIQYYYYRQLITEDEMLLLQKDLYRFVDAMEYAVSRKIEYVGFSSNIYISSTQIESSGLYCKCDDEQLVSLWISYGVSISSDNPRICNTYRSWFNSLKKYSSLISGTNEILRTKFIDRQRSLIENIKNAKDKDYFYE
ncbi:helix-turn-helix domain-containing protein [Dysgonomonas sp. 520]|uniref:helix-turn-helix domain-containing protein n=1 Tax=Dysgonomonas sp. 520 TaxID=2302931 RepID=UPI0013D03CF2|nr:helix-turn-helix domain-containing protein [Dysgonomonas sp. 520]NDW10780.1 hypothetical protein [Dysgonomonas sp. 520]